MARYSAKQRRWFGLRSYREGPAVDLYEGGPQLAERNRQTEIVLPNGMIRVDIGEPLPGHGDNRRAE